MGFVAMFYDFARLVVKEKCHYEGDGDLTQEET